MAARGGKVSMSLFCPRCQARLDSLPDSPDGPVTCPSCQAVFTVAGGRNDTPRGTPRRIRTRRLLLLVIPILVGLGLVILLGVLAVSLYFGPDSARPLPTVTVETSYPRANAQVVADTVAAPIEVQVAGVEGLVGMRSQSRDDGTYTLTITFQRRLDLNVAQVLVQNRIALAMPMLPELVNRHGVSVRRKSPGAVMILNVVSPDGSHDALALSNYATVQLRDELARLPGVGDLTFVGQRDHAVRVWLDAAKLANRALTAGNVVRALEQQNVQVVPGQTPEGPLALLAPGRPVDPEKLENIVLKTDPDGSTIRLRDVARVEIGRDAFSGDVLLDGKPAVALVIHPTPQASPRELSDALRGELELLRARLPAGVDLDAAFDFTANLAAARWQATPGYLLLDVDLPPGASPQRRLEVVQRCAAVVGEVAGVRGVLALTEHPFDLRRGAACVLARLGPAEEKRADREQTLRTVRDRLAEVEGAKVRLRDLSGPGRCWECRYPVEFAVHGPEADRVREFAGKLAGRLRQDPGLTDVWAGADDPPHPQLIVTVDAVAAQAHGVTAREVLDQLQVHLGERNVGEFERFGRSWQVTVKAEPGAGDRTEELKNLRIRNSGGRMVPLSVLAAVRLVEVPAAVERLNLLPMVAVTANPASGVSLTQARALCEARAEEVRRELGLTAEYRLTWL
jgi:multidrug efflux pump subunit AcrB